MREALRFDVQTRIARLALLFALGLAPVTSGCGLLNGPTKTAKGELYTSGDGRYDPYFDAVHREQTAAQGWKEEEKSARRPIVSALNLEPGASNYAILGAVKKKKGEASLGSAVSETTNAERERARRMKAAADKLAEMKKRGEELKKQAAADKKNAGADKADEKKAAKKDEIKRELSAAVDAVDDLESDARDNAKTASELASKLRPAWDGKDEPDRPPPKPPEPEEKKEEKPEEKKEDKPAARKPPPPRPKPSPAEPSDKPEKPSKPPDEVFNP